MLLLKAHMVRAFAFLGILALLSGCGFQPLYGENQQAFENVSIQQELSSVWVLEIEDREGQILHNRLLSLFNAKGRPQNPKYQLKVTYNEGSSGLGIGKDEFATRANLNTSATFTLTGPRTFSGISQSVVSYNILTSPTGTEFAKRDARNRAIENLAQDIYRRVAITFLTPEQETQK